MQMRRVRHGTVIVLSAVLRFELKDTEEWAIQAVRP